MRILGVVSYQGTAYQGWQKQLFIPTVQGTIEEVLSKYFNSEINICGSGRTDAGVHAYGQTFHFDIHRDEIDLDRLLYSINQMLPQDIYIYSFDMVDDDFHARLSAKGKEYVYAIEIAQKNPFAYSLIDVEKEPFDIKKFSECLKLFTGEHNFQNFTSKEDDERGFVRHVKDIKVNVENDAISVSLIGNGFMRYMVRYIIGTALAYARDKISLSKINELINCVDAKRQIVSFKAPAEGLYLNQVFY